MVDASSGTFLRWLSVDRGFRADLNSNLTGLVGGELNTDGTWSGGVEAPEDGQPHLLGLSFNSIELN